MMDATKRAEYIKRLWNANTADEIAAILDEYDAEQLPTKLEPNWEEAPDWANWWAVNEDGDSWWFECEPPLSRDQWLMNGNWNYAGNVNLNGFNWRETLTHRP